jgi:group I intron endonuclease
MKKIIGIYKLTNPVGKIYIGQSIDIHKRWYAYNRLIRTSMGLKLFNSLKKYSPENHTFEIIEECIVDELIIKETFYKKMYNCVENGLNSKYEDDRSGPHTQETKHLISKKCLEAAKIRVYTDEWRINMKQKKTGHICYKSEERSRKIGLAHKGKIVSNETKARLYTEQWKEKNIQSHKFQEKKVSQFTLNGDFVKLWDSINIAKKTTGIGGINNALTGRAKTAGNFIWKYYE